MYRTLLDIANGIHYLHSVGIVHGAGSIPKFLYCLQDVANR